MAENICEEIRLVDNILQAEDFVRLRIQAGLVEIPVEHARKALHNGLMNVSAIYNGELVGMGRLVGDGAMYWYLQEIIILPQFQRKGIGTMIVNHLVDYARENSKTGKFITNGGVSAKGKEPRFSCVYNRYFYAKEMMRYENIIRYIQIHANTEGDHNLALR